MARPAGLHEHCIVVWDLHGGVSPACVSLSSAPPQCGDLTCGIAEPDEDVGSMTPVFRKKSSDVSCSRARLIVHSQTFWHVPVCSFEPYLRVESVFWSRASVFGPAPTRLHRPQRLSVTGASLPFPFPTKRTSAQAGGLPCHSAPWQALSDVTVRKIDGAQSLHKKTSDNFVRAFHRSRPRVYWRAPPPPSGDQIRRALGSRCSGPNVLAYGQFILPVYGMPLARTRRSRWTAVLHHAHGEAHDTRLNRLTPSAAQDRPTTH